MRIAREAAATFFSWVLQLIAILIFAPLALEGLGKQNFGVWMVAVSVPVLAAQLDFGWSAFIVRWWLAQANNISSSVTKRSDGFAAFAVLCIGCAVGAVIGFAVFVILFSFSGVLGWSSLGSAHKQMIFISIFSAWSGLAVASGVWAGIWRAERRLVSLSAIQTISGVGLWLWLAYAASSANLIYIALISLVWVGACTVPISWLLIRRSTKAEAKVGAIFQLLKAFWDERRYASGVMSAQAASVITFQIDRFVLSAVSGPSITGVYALLAGIAAKLLQALSVTTTVLYPVVAKLHLEVDQSKVNEVFVLSSRIVLVTVIALSASWWVASATFLRLWLQDAYRPEYVIALRLLILAAALAACSIVPSNVYLASGRSLLTSRYAWLGAGITLASCFVLIPYGGLIGAATAVCFGCFQAIIFARHVRVSMRLSKALNRPLLCVLGVATLTALIGTFLAEDVMKSWVSLAIVATAVGSIVVAASLMLMTDVRHFVLAKIQNM